MWSVACGIVNRGSSACLEFYFIFLFCLFLVEAGGGGAQMTSFTVNKEKVYGVISDIENKFTVKKKKDVEEKR